MRKATIFLSFIISFSVHADDVSFDRLMDSYMVAKADVAVYDFKEEELKRWPYTIQVASYLSEKDASRHVQELKLQEDTAFYFPTFAKGQVWFKVCVGRFDAVAKAEAHRKDFVKRMEEPFAAVIALGDTSRKPATADVALNLSKEAAALPVQQGAKGTDKSKMKVQLISKQKAAGAVPTVVADADPEAKPIAEKPSTHYTLQVAAYPTKAEAEAKLSELKATYSSQGIVVHTAEVNGKIWYRVYVGLFTEKSEADAFKSVYTEQTHDKKAFIKKLSQK